MLERNKMAGRCKWRFALVDGVRTDIADVVSGQRGICPVCKAPLVAKKRTIRVPHWSHFGARQCDDWYQPKGPWHRYWQDQFPDDWQEVVVEREGVKHIADVKAANDIVIEIQWSPISCEEISAREKFYNKMLWIVGASDTSNNGRLKRFIERSLEDTGYGACVWEADDVSFESEKWLNCMRPVFVDVNGAEDVPESDGNLYYIMPRKSSSDGVFIASVARQEFVAALCKGTTREFFSRFRDARDKLVRDRQARLNETIVQMRAEEISQRQEQDRARREKASKFVRFADDARHAIAFVHKEFHHPPRCALTVGWVDAYLIVEGLRKHLVLGSNLMEVAPYGRVALHQARDCSLQNYEQDCQYARERGVDVDFPQYDELSLYADKIIACVDYLVKHTDSGILLTFASPFWILKSDGKAYTWNRNELVFWTLPVKTQDYLGNVDVDS